VKEDIDTGEGETKHGVYYPKRGVTTAEASLTYSGDPEGTSTVLYLITYRPDEAAPVLAVERFVGSVGGREGSFVMTSTGTQSPGEVHGHAEVVAGLGTGDLATLRGEIDLVIKGMSEDGYPLVMMYDLD